MMSIERRVDRFRRLLPMTQTVVVTSPQNIMAVEQIDAAHMICSGPLQWKEYTMLPGTKDTDVVAVFECSICRRRVYIEVETRYVTT